MSGKLGYVCISYLFGHGQGVGQEIWITCIGFSGIGQAGVQLIIRLFMCIWLIPRLLPVWQCTSVAIGEHGHATVRAIFLPGFYPKRVGFDGGVVSRCGSVGEEPQTGAGRAREQPRAIGPSWLNGLA